jgi:hypothetical protein
LKVVNATTAAKQANNARRAPIGYSGVTKAGVTVKDSTVKTGLLLFR